MATLPERTRPLHNFSLPPFSWGCRRVLKRIKFGAGAGADPYTDAPFSDRKSSASPDESDGCNPFRDENSAMKLRSPNFAGNFEISPAKPIGGDAVRKSHKEWDDNGIDAFREKIMSDLRLAAEKLKVPILEERNLVVPTPATPWNLRTRRAAFKAPKDSVAGGGGNEENLWSEERRRSDCISSPVVAESPMMKAKSIRLKGLAAGTTSATPARAESPILNAKSIRLKGLAAAAATETPARVEKRPRFSVSLSRKEIESDFMAMAGTKLKRRPKKRPKIVQKYLDSVFPGLCLREVTLDDYKV